MSLYNLRKALCSIHSHMSHNNKDWSVNKSDARIYGIVYGWSNENYKELANKFGWSDVHIEQNKQFHKEYSIMMGES